MKMERECPDISVIVPIYNTENYLKECFDSIIRAAGGLSWEAILVDDGSEDDGRLIYSAYQEKYENFRCFYRENAGQGSARNFAVSQARGKYIFFLDSDDFVEPGLFEMMFRLAEDTGSEVTVCNVSYLRNGKAAPSVMHLREFSAIPADVHVVRWDTVPELFFDSIMCNKLILREWYASHGLAFQEGKTFEDMLLSVRVFHLAERVAVLRTRGYYWRRRGDKENRSTTQRSDSLKNLLAKIDTLKSILAYAEREIRDERVSRILELKCISIDLMAFWNALPALSEERAGELVGAMAAFLNENIRPETVSELSAIQRQLYLDTVRFDRERLIRTVSYKELIYPYLPVGDDRMLRYNEEIITHGEHSARGDFRYYVPISKICGVSILEGEIVFSCQLYMKRISVRDLSGMEVSAFLLNDLSGEVVPLTVTPRENPELTEAQGVLISREDCMPYRYCYDGTGFDIHLLTGDVPAEEDYAARFESVPHLILLRYVFPGLTSGVRVLRGVSLNVKTELGKVKIEAGAFTGEFSFDRSEALVYTYHKTESTPRSALKIDLRYYQAHSTSLKRENALLLKTNEQALEVIGKQERELKKLKGEQELSREELKTLREDRNRLTQELDSQIKKNERDRNSWNWKVGSAMLAGPKAVRNVFKKGKD